MAITFVDQSTFTVAAGAGEVSQALPVSLQNDIVLIVLAADTMNEGAGNDGIVGQGYTSIVGPTGTAPGRQIAYKRMGATPDTSVTIDQEAAVIMAGLCQIWRGVDTTTAEDATSTAASGTSANPDSPAIITVTANALVLSISMLDDDDATVTTYPSGYTNTLSKNTGQGSTTVGATVSIASTIRASAGSEDPGAYTMSSSDAWFANSVAFRPAGGITSGPHAAVAAGVGVENFVGKPAVFASTARVVGAENFRLNLATVASTAVAVGVHNFRALLLAASVVASGVATSSSSLIFTVTAVATALGLATRTITTKISRDAVAVVSNIGALLAAISRSAVAVGVAGTTALLALISRGASAIGVGTASTSYLPGAPETYTGSMYCDEDYKGAMRDLSNAGLLIGQLPASADYNDFSDWLNMAWGRLTKGAQQYWKTP